MDERPDPEGTEDDALCRRLWLTVILRAKLDAEGRDLMIDGDFERPFIMKEAKEWLTGTSSDLKWVCHAAGIDVNRILGKFREEYGLR